MTVSTLTVQSPLDNTLLLTVIILVVVLVAVIVFVAFRRRNARPISRTRNVEEEQQTPKPSASFCTNCGARLPEGYRFCGKCGEKQQ
jgi:ribosomal protein L40E